MKSQLQPWRLLLLILAGWINGRQQDAVESAASCGTTTAKRPGLVCHVTTNVVPHDCMRRQQATIHLPVTNRRALHPSRLKHEPGIVRSWQRPKLPPIHASKPSKIPQLQEVRVFSPHGLRIGRVAAAALKTALCERRTETPPYSDQQRHR